MRETASENRADCLLSRLAAARGLGTGLLVGGVRVLLQQQLAYSVVEEGRFSVIKGNCLSLCSEPAAHLTWAFRQFASNSGATVSEVGNGDE